MNLRELTVEGGGRYIWRILTSNKEEVAVTITRLVSQHQVPLKAPRLFRLFKIIMPMTCLTSKPRNYGHPRSQKTTPQNCQCFTKTINLLSPQTRSNKLPKPLGALRCTSADPQPNPCLIVRSPCTLVAPQDWHHRLPSRILLRGKSSCRGWLVYWRVILGRDMLKRQLIRIKPLQWPLKH